MKPGDAQALAAVALGLDAEMAAQLEVRARPDLENDQAVVIVAVIVTLELFVDLALKATTVVAGPTGLKVTSGFEIKLPDYKIKIPKLMFMKLNELITLKLEFNLKPATDSK